MKENWKPILFNPAHKAHNARLSLLRRSAPKPRVVDTLEDQYAELAETRFSTVLPYSRLSERWIYYPWRHILVHTLAPALFQELRTSRNRNLITQEDQEKLRNSPIAIAGLSVGNTIAGHLILEGFEDLRLADFDTLSLSNLNRLRTSVIDLGIPKTIITARQIYEIHPYVHIDIFSRGIRTKQEIERFATKPRRAALIIDETDSLETKLELRRMAKKERIAVVSAADNDTNAIISIERFDSEPERELYHGVLKGIALDIVDTMTKAEKIGIINKMVGEKFITERMKASLAQVGTTLHTWPQLGGAAAASAAAICYAAKRIILSQNLPSGFYHLDFDTIFTSVRS